MVLAKQGNQSDLRDRFGNEIEARGSAMPKLIVFDFDGVIVESADIKTDAFRELFKDCKEVGKIVEYHKKNGGVSRYEKFEYIYKNFLHKTLTAKHKAELSEKFSGIVVDKIKQAPLVEGVVEFLEKYSNDMKFVIASATPDGELKGIVKFRGLDRYFSLVEGAPRRKSEVIKDAFGLFSFGKSECLFVGDAINDYREAGVAGVKFVGRIAHNQQSPFPEGTITIKTMHDLDSLISAWS